MKNKKGFTLIELLLVLMMMGILIALVPLINRNVYDRFLLRTTANEVKSALHLAQQLSIDESREYCVELIGNKLRVREQVLFGRVVLVKELSQRVTISPESHERITYNRDGVTAYGQFVFTNSKKEKMRIQVDIGTGKAKIIQQK
ncbi:prepilin-type N-terminal cleavage/methylation domain-containing protein [Natronincola ferrireducens]|uniref:Competence protein ComGD n=1 Tax=Natronincola ferrireducens TaxID=393762 RepID=A0A1G9CJS5_9FIRM|nr:prepilin-type N-terminal cleavage/methylation domain-containing protein [Natronincola ferrireducens]SDK51920.1 competence protein ComGD [Natronincola ferrireducens]